MTWWMKLDCDFHLNEKVVAAGRNGRDVFLRLMCIHGKERLDGVIPADLVPGERVLAGVLQCSVEDVRDGWEACRDVQLLRRSENGDVTILGWDDEWRPKESTAASRMRAMRERKRNVTSRDASEGVTLRDERNDERNVTSRYSRLSDLSRIEDLDHRKEEIRETERNVTVTLRGKNKRQILAKHRELAEKIWATQNTLRQASIPGARSLTATDAALTMVAQILEAGHSLEDCEHVLRVYAAEAQARPESREWFNGETNWRIGNFRRQLGRSAAPRRPSARGTNAGMTGDDVLAWGRGEYGDPRADYDDAIEVTPTEES